MRKRDCWVLALCVSLLTGCTVKKPASGSAELRTSVSEDTKYGAAILRVSCAEFEQAGFRLGDSCDIEFGNGYTLTDVPYYNGYYVRNEEPVVVAYPGFDDIRITYNNVGIWNTAALNDGTAVTVRVRQAGKYTAVQEALGQVYSVDRAQYESDAQFCNFRALSGGNLREDFLFRGASPVDNSRGRASYTDSILSQHGIAYILDIADTAEDMEGYLAAPEFDSPYTAALYEDGAVTLLGLGSAFRSEEYQRGVASGMRAMLDTSGPVYIHCMEGKDRTGFVCMLLEALAGADYEEMRTDYMKTYANYYSVTQEEMPEKYEAISELYFDAFVSYLYGTEDPKALRSADYTQAAAAYLTAGGMTQTEVARLRELITE